MSRISHLRFRKNGTYVTDTILRDYGKSFRASGVHIAGTNLQKDHVEIIK